MAITPLVWSIDATGITTPTQADYVAWYTANFLAIYGVDLSTQDSSSPDNQAMMIWVQANLDSDDLDTQIFNTFDPDNAIGTVLDQRVAINGIQRQAGTFSTTAVTLVVSQSINLYGLDQSSQPIYTVQDSAGNQWQLVTSQVPLSPDTYSLIFQSTVPGAVLTTPNTITTQVTIVLGVDSVNNPTNQITVGINEESDSALKIRRQKSTALSSQGYYEGLIAALENVPGVSFVNVIENDTDGTVNSVPSHSIWVIVAGSASDQNIATAIYNKRNAGCGMFGSQTYTIVRPNGNSLVVHWDNVTEVNLFTYFVTASLDTTNPPNIAAIRSGLVSSFTPGVAEKVNANQVASDVLSIDPNTFVTGAVFSIETVQTITLSGIAASGAFVLTYGSSSTASIAWNDSISTIQGKLRAITGLGSVTASGSIASQSIVVTMTGVTNPSMIGIGTNSLMTSGPAAITFNFISAFTNTLATSANNYQFSILEENIIITPMIMSASGVGYSFSGGGSVTGTTITVANGGSTVDFEGLGGYGAYAYILVSGNGSIGATTGIYTSGTAGTDVVKVTDALGNSATCTITVS